MIKNYSPVAGLELSLRLDDNKYESFFPPFILPHFSVRSMDILQLILFLHSLYLGLILRPGWKEKWSYSLLVNLNFASDPLLH